MILYKNFIFVFSLALLLGFAVFATATTISLPNPLCIQGSHPNCVGQTYPNANFTSEYACNQANGRSCTQSFPDLISAITQFITIIIGGLAVIMFIWAGILFVTSAGNDARLASAKKAAWWAVIGTAIALAGEALVLVARGVIGTGP